MKLKNCEEGQIVEFKKSTTKDNLTSDGYGYGNWHPSCQHSANEIFSGGLGKIDGIVDNVVVLEVVQSEGEPPTKFCVDPKFIKLVKDSGEKND